MRITRTAEQIKDDNSTQTKVCTKCRVRKPFGSFRSRPGVDGRTSECRECMSTSSRGYRRTPEEAAYDASTQTKLCPKCKKRKPYDSFHSSSTAVDGVAHRCKECVGIYTAAYRDTPEIKRCKREKAYMTKYGITIAEYEAIRDNQGGVCAICGGTDKVKRLAVDHCHITNKVRGLLCSDCNTGLGKFGDNLEGLKRAVKYLEI